MPFISFYLKYTEVFGSVCFNFQLKKKKKRINIIPLLTTGLGLGVYTLPVFTPLEDLCLPESTSSGLGRTVNLTGSITDGVGM